MFRSFASSLFAVMALSATTSSVQAAIVLGDLGNTDHEVQGTVVALSEKLLEFQNFGFDGLPPSTFFWADVGDTPSSQGFILPSPDFDCSTDNDNSLPVADGTVSWRAELPDGYDLSMVKTISVWCKTAGASFGHLTLTDENLLNEVKPAKEGPALSCHSEAKLGVLNGNSHLVQGSVYALSDSLIEIRGFSFDGEPPATFVWGDVSAVPTGDGKILPSSAHWCTADAALPALAEVTIRADVPGGLTALEGGSLSIWCTTALANFGEMVIDAAALRDVPGGENVAPECPDFDDSGLAPNDPTKDDKMEADSSATTIVAGLSAFLVMAISVLVI